MCARIAYVILAGLFVDLTVTVAAFVYLEWWQALLVSAATFVGLVLVGRFLAKRLVRRLVGQASAVARVVLGGDGHVLRGATVDVHAVRPVGPTGAGGHQFELTIFPDPAAANPTAPWVLTDLRLAPTNGGPALDLHDLQLIEAGEPVQLGDATVFGPRRVRFTAAVPRGVHDLVVRYRSEAFGSVRVPPVLPALR